MDKMMEIAKLIGYPVIFTAIVGMFSGIYGYFQKKREEYRKYINERKQKKIDALANLTTNLLLIPIDNITEFNETLLKISQLINPYGKKIKTFGKYQWVKGDGYIWYQMDVIDQKIKNDSLELADLKELANRIQISIKLFEVQYENDVSPISVSKIAFYLLQYILIFIPGLGLYFIFQKGSLNEVEVLSVSIVFLPIIILIFLLPELAISSDKKLDSVALVIGSILCSGYNSFISFKYFNNNNSAFIVTFAIIFILIWALICIKATIFGESEVGKVSTIYEDEYKSL